MVLFQLYKVFTYLLYDLIYCLQKPAAPLAIDIFPLKAPPTEMPHRIPRIIHQTQKTSKLPWDLYAATKQLIHMNPTYEYKFYDDKGCVAALEAHFGHDSPQMRAYQRLEPPAYRADIFRLCILFAEGGVYMDCKATTIAPIDSFLKADADFVGVADVNEARLQTGAFLACTPRNLVIGQMMNIAIARVLLGDYGTSYLDIAGPERCGRVLKELVGMKETDKFRVGRRYNAISDCKVTKIDIIGVVRLFDFYVHDENYVPIIKLQNISYLFSWRRLVRRYEIAWALRRVFND